MLKKLLYIFVFPALAAGLCLLAMRFLPQDHSPGPVNGNIVLVLLLLGLAYLAFVLGGVIGGVFADRALEPSLRKRELAMGALTRFSAFLLTHGASVGLFMVMVNSNTDKNLVFVAPALGQIAGELVVMGVHRLRAQKRQQRIAVARDLESQGAKADSITKATGLKPEDWAQSASA